MKDQSPEKFPHPSSEMRVNLATSKRLREMMKGAPNLTIDDSTDKSDKLAPPADLPAASKQAWLNARRLIDERIEQEFARLPEARKLRLFAIRYGSLEALKATEIPLIFRRLGLDERRVDLNRLRKINYHGQIIP